MERIFPFKGRMEGGRETKEHVNAHMYISNN
jgi:hypothetical protein